MRGPSPQGFGPGGRGLRSPQSDGATGRLARSPTQALELFPAILALEGDTGVHLLASGQCSTPTKMGDQLVQYHWEWKNGVEYWLHAGQQ
jgi:hypothetical protein